VDINYDPSKTKIAPVWDDCPACKFSWCCPRGCCYHVDADIREKNEKSAEAFYRED